MPLLAATLFLAVGSATAASDNQTQPAPSAEQSPTVPEPTAPWLALVFAAVLIAIRNRTLRH